MAGFWWFIIEIQLFGSLGTTFLWIIPTMGNLIVLVLNHKNSIIQYIKSKPTIFVYIWILLEICAIGMCFINLGLIWMDLRLIWLIIGCFLGCLIPEMLLINQHNQGQLKLWQNWFLILAFILGILFPLVPNIYDPISSYLTIIFWILNGFMMIPQFHQLQKKQN
jgi:hypothetical protein